MSTKLGDFTGLAQHYTRYRAGYSHSVSRAILGTLGRDASQLDGVDVGAGTGIWSRQVAQLGFRSVHAVEPNEDMFNHGIASSEGSGIVWSRGSAEQTGLPDQCCDLVSMASSFHWADFDLASQEFCRILRPGGRFTALWNPRVVDESPLLVEIEDFLSSLRPEMKRVSSGRSDFTAQLSDRLRASSYWEDLVYIEGRHIELQSPERYLGLWRSVNDVQAQLGPQKFAQFLEFVEGKVTGLEHIEATYQTRAWVVRKRG